MVLGNSRYLIYGSSWEYHIVSLLVLVLMKATQPSCPGDFVSYSQWWAVWALQVSGSLGGSA